MTDFPDTSLISNLHQNIQANIPSDTQNSVIAEGYTWGSKIDKLLRSLDESHKYFDTVLAADLVFSEPYFTFCQICSLLTQLPFASADHSQHLALLKTCEACLTGAGDPVLLCFYSHHR